MMYLQWWREAKSGIFKRCDPQITGNWIKRHSSHILFSHFGRILQWEPIQEPCQLLFLQCLNNWKKKLCRLHCSKSISAKIIQNCPAQCLSTLWYFFFTKYNRKIRASMYNFGSIAAKMCLFELWSVSLIFCNPLNTCEWYRAETLCKILFWFDWWQIMFHIYLLCLFLHEAKKVDQITD